MTQNRPSRTLFVVYACAIVTGAALVCWQTIVFHQQKASFQWPTVSGTIVQSERIYVPSDHNSHYRVEITYNYKVKGTSYVSHRISLFSRDLSSYDDISESFVANHRPGTSVEIYYEPSRPENAVLIPGPDETFSEFELGVGLIAIIGSIFAIIRLIPRRRRLAALLNAPDAATRTMHLRMDDIDKGTTAFVRNVGAALLFTVAAMAFLLAPWMQHPAVLLERPHPKNPWLMIAGIGCVLVVIFFVRRALKKGRSAECPLCGTFLNKTVFSTNECPGCRTRIIFEDENPRTVSSSKI